MIGLTPRQKEVLGFLRSFKEQNGVMPSMDEIAYGVGLKARSGAKRIVDGLVSRGAIRRLNHRARALELVELEEKQAVLINREIFVLLRAYATGQGIGIDAAAGELLRMALGAA